MNSLNTFFYNCSHVDYIEQGLIAYCNFLDFQCALAKADTGTLFFILFLEKAGILSPNPSINCILGKL